jgi:hypothetical protein
VRLKLALLDASIRPLSNSIESESGLDSGLVAFSFGKPVSTPDQVEDKLFRKMLWHWRQIESIRRP